MYDNKFGVIILPKKQTPESSGRSLSATESRRHAEGLTSRCSAQSGKKTPFFKSEIIPTVVILVTVMAASGYIERSAGKAITNKCEKLKNVRNNLRNMLLLLLFYYIIRTFFQFVFKKKTRMSLL